MLRTIFLALAGTLCLTNSFAEKVALTGAKIGSIAPGQYADLVVLNSNPLEDLGHASDIDTVIKNGVVYPVRSLLP